MSLEKSTFTNRVETIAAERIGAFLSRAFRYVQLVASSGLGLTIILLLIVGMIYYQDIRDWIPAQTPMSLIYAFIFTFFSARSLQRNFLQETDLLFLTPLESDMKRYFRMTFVYNFVVQAVMLCAVLLILTPLYKDLIQSSYSLWIYFSLPLVLKAWNLQSSWFVFKLRHERLIQFHTVLRYAFTFVVLYWFFSEGSLLLLIIFGVMGILFTVYESKVNQMHSYDWLKLIEVENRLLSRFYAFCQSFVEVPHLPGKIRTRSWLTWLTRSIPFQREQALRYLYVKTFLRAGDYFGIYVRLTVIGAAVLYVVQDPWGQWVVYLLILYLSGLQLQAVWGHHKHQFWLTVFPVTDQLAARSFQALCLFLLVLQAVLMSITVFLTAAEAWQVLALLGTGVLLAYVYSYFMLSTKLKTQN